MKQLFINHLQRLHEEKIQLEKYLVEHSKETQTSLYAGVQLGLAWHKIKIAFWSALLDQNK